LCVTFFDHPTTFDGQKIVSKIGNFHYLCQNDF
jgi:hypothetical protein